jgi:tRNA(Ile)-lysidine synthase
MLDKVQSTIVRYKMLAPGDRVLVAVSGGVDSMVLLHVLRELQKSEKLSLAVAHFDHAIRPDSAQDAEFVQGLAQSLKLQCYTERAAVPVYATAKKISLEVAARQLRYRFLEKTAKTHKFNKIALGHTLNDQAETLLMRLLRGSGLEGLSGIPPVRPAGTSRRLYIRPLLECTREQIEAFANTKNLQWHEDPTNKDTAILRNKIRHELIPILKEYNPKILEALGRTARLLGQAARQLEREASRALTELTCKKEAHELALDLKKFLQLSEHLQALVLRQAVFNVNALSELEAAHIEAVLTWLSRPGELHLPAGVRVLRRHNQLIVTARPAVPPKRFEYLLTVPSETVLPEIGWRFVIRSLHPHPRPLSPLREREDKGVRGRALLDADKIQGSLVVRNRRPGDRIRLKEGTKKLQDFFVDRKIPREARDAIPLICDADALIWIVGEAVSEAYRVTPQTQRALEIIAEQCEGAV